MAWGYHLSIDAFGCDSASIRDQFHIKSFVENLVPAIDMKAFGGPLIIKFGTGDTAGYTLCQLIETSNITAHFADESNAMYFDLFSCKPYDKELVLSMIRQFFRPTDVKVNFVERGNPASASPAPELIPVAEVTSTETTTTSTTKKKTTT